MLKHISPVAWRHINLRGRFEFQKQHTFNVDKMISALTQETGWQHLQETEETAGQNPYFTFSVR
jgi:hypothetical protein